MKDSVQLWVIAGCLAVMSFAVVFFAAIAWFRFGGWIDVFFGFIIWCYCAYMYSKAMGRGRYYRELENKQEVLIDG